MITTNKPNIALLSRLCATKGIEHVVVSPGSRNAPLSIAFNREKRITTHVIVDERSAAFIALGLAQKSQKCVVLICTSGTALLNMTPAIAEAFYQKIPLLIVSADRPEEWIDQDDSQTIHQNHLINNIVKRSYQLPENCNDLWWTNRIINEAIDLTTIDGMGPVHLNVPIDTPLYRTENITINEKVIHLIGGNKIDIDEKFIKEATENKKVMILSGFILPNERLNQMAIDLANKGIAFEAECLSNLHNTKINNLVEDFFNEINKKNITDYKPDLLIIVGGAIVSKSAKLFFRKNTVKQVWQIGENDHIIDTFKQITTHIKCNISCFFEQLINKMGTPDLSYAQKIINKNNAIEKSINNDGFEKIIFDLIFDHLPKGSDLHLSNGTCVRNGLRFKNNKDINFYANRGTSGIDGCTSTALGSSLINLTTTTLITGDLCFLYDSNALWNNEEPYNYKIIIVNNHGGGIFSKMEGPKTTEEYERFFLTPQSVSIKNLAAAYKINYYQSKDIESLSENLNSIYHQKGLCILEIEM